MTQFAENSHSLRSEIPNAGQGGDGEDGGVFGINAGWYQSERLRFGVEGFAGTAKIYGGEASIQWQPFDSTSNWVIGVHGGGGWFDGSGFYSAGIGVLYHFAAPKVSNGSYARIAYRESGLT